MSPPPITPSAHRFLPPGFGQVAELALPPASTRPEQQPTPQTALRQFASTPKFILNPGNGKDRQWPAPFSSSSPAERQQFATPPRFIPSTARPIGHGQDLTQLSSPATLRRLCKPALQADRKEDIEESHADHTGWDEEGGDLEAQEKALPHQLDPNSCALNPSSPPLRKRRRLGSLTTHDPDPILISSSDHTFSSPPPSPAPLTTTLILTPPRPTASAPNHPRFRIPGPSPSSPPPPVPKFLLPAPPSPPPAPTSTFSPPHPSQKYLPHGLASSVRDLVMETALQASHLARLRTRTNTSKPEDETWDFRIEVSDARKGGLGQGIMLIRAAEGKGWALLGRGGRALRGSGGGGGSWSGNGAVLEKGKGSEGDEEGEAEAEIQKGYEVRVRKPVWEVELLGEKWAVAVEWEVLRREES